MGEIVNLRLVRKRKARAEAENDAAVRRSDFGRKTSSKTSDQQERERAERRLDAHRLTPGEDGA